MLARGIVILLTGLASQAAAAASDVEGMPLKAALRLLEEQGLAIIYSTDLVKSDMYVIGPITESQPRAQLEEILRPHDLAVSDGPNDMLFIVRASGENQHTQVMPSAIGAVPTVVVEASRYALVKELAHVSTTVSAAEIRSIPNVGEDPLRTLARLPGTASNDFSARLNIRGGTTEETLIRLDGMRLHNPFHLKDFQSLFSAIDSAFVDTIDVYTGGFPAYLGDRMSGVMDIKTIAVPERPQRELSLSLFHASGLVSGHMDESTDWLVSARRGNLDLVLDLTNTEVGRPQYVDSFAKLTHRFSDRASVSGNFLGMNDDIRVNDTDGEENAVAEYRDRYFWLAYDQRWSNAWSTRLLVSRTEVDSERLGTADQPGIGSGTLSDERSHSIDAISLAAEWWPLQIASLTFGGDWRQVRGEYVYRDEAEFDLLFDEEGAPQEPQRSRELSARPKGDLYGIYSSLRLAPRPELILDLGLRWDRSTLPESDDAELSPRINLLYEPNERTRLRAGWGEYAQMQGVDELPIADGVSEFSAAQRSEQWVLSAERVLLDHTLLRLELYHKRYSVLHPRFENFLNTTALLPELKPDRMRIAPISALAEGIELSARRTDRGPLFWWASYAWTRAQDRIVDEEVLRSWDQEHAISTGIGWRQKQWQMSIAAHYHSGWPSSTAELLTDDPMPIASVQRNATRLKNYLDIDLRVARDFNASGGDSLSVFFELSNVLNRNNECCIEYEFEDEDGEQFLELERVKSLGILPSIGFTYSF